MIVDLSEDERIAICGALLAAAGAARDNPNTYATGMMAFNQSKVAQLRSSADSLLDKLGVPPVADEVSGEKGTEA